MDTIIQNVTLDEGKMTRLHEVSFPFMKGMSYWLDEKKLVVVSISKLSESEKEQIKSAVNNLSSIPVPQKTQKEILMETLNITQSNLDNLKKLAV